MKKIIVFVASSLLLVGNSFSQTVPRSTFNRNSFWTETVINGVIHNKLKWQLDFQYRRMSDASDVNGGSTNLFKNSFQHVYRPWIHYQLNENVRFSISPLGFWETYTPAVESSGVKMVQPEYRICPQLTLTNKIGRVTVDQRYRYEFRYLGTKVANQKSNEFDYSEGFDFPQANQKGRVRYFVRAIVPFGKHQSLENNTFYLIAWNEAFLSVGKNVNNDKLWDQNRLFCLLGYKPNMSFPMRFELGYGLQTANRFTSTVTNGVLTETGNKIEKNNILQVYIIFENFNKLFKRDKPADSK